MRHRNLLAPGVIALLCLGLAACGSSRQTQPGLLVITPNPRVSGPTMKLAPSVPCRPAAESGPARSDLVFAGPCAFTERAAVECAQRTDDFEAYVYHHLGGGWTLYTIISVEGYTGPKTYSRVTQIYMEVGKGISIYAWGQSAATAAVGDGGKRLTLQTIDVPPWSGTLARGREYLGGSVQCSRVLH